MKPTKAYRAPDAGEGGRRSATCATGCCAWDGPADQEALQAEVYAVGRAHGFEPLRDWFRRSTRCCSGPMRGRASAGLWRSTAFRRRRR